METTQTEPSRLEQAPSGAPRYLLASAALGAWALHDLAFFLASSQPLLAKELIPGSVLVVTGGVFLTALLCAHERLFLGALALLALASVLPAALDLETSLATRWLPRVAFVSGAIVLLSERVAARFRFEAVGIAVLLGLAAGGLLCGWRLGAPQPVSGVLLLAAAVDLIAARRRARAGRSTAALRAGIGLSLVAALLLSMRTATALRRPDLEIPGNAARAAAPNLLFVVLDTVRADHLAPYGAARATTPVLDAFVHDHARRYAQARSTSSWTLPAHASLFTGLFPDQHGATRPRVAQDASALDLQAWPARPLRPDVTTLAEELRGRGYRTAALLANTSYLRHEFGLDRGFERYDDRHSAWFPEYLALAHLVGGGLRAGFLPYREARTISDLALRWLEEHPARPFFLFLNYMDAHAPYFPPLGVDDGDPRWPRDPRAPQAELHSLLYDRELAYLDRELGRVLDVLERASLLENTAIVITSDHGEAFGEHGTWLHGWDLHEEVLRVPLYVKPAGGLAPGAARVEQSPVTGAHVLGITLEALGLPGRPAPEQGVVAQLHVTEYLMERWRARGVALLGRTQAAFLEGDLKHLVSGEGSVRSYDLSGDPGEERPLALEGGALDAVRRRAARFWERHPAPANAGPDAVLEERDRRRLEGLGYLGDG